MEPFTREVIIAQHQRDLRREAEERRLAARAGISGAARRRAGRILFALAELLTLSADRALRRAQCRDASRARSLPQVAAHLGVTPPGCPEMMRQLRLIHGPAQMQELAHVAGPVGVRTSGSHFSGGGRCPVNGR